MMRSLMQLLVRLPLGLRQKVPVTQLGTLIVSHILRTMCMRTYIEDEMRFKIVKIILLDGIEWHKGQTFGLFLECSTHFGLAVDRMYTGQVPRTTKHRPDAELYSGKIDVCGTWMPVDCN